MATAPARWVFLFTSIPFALIMGLWVWLADRDAGWAFPVIGGLLAGAAFGGLLAFLTQRSLNRDKAATGTGTRGEVLTLNRAIGRGRPPEDPALDEAALTLIARRRRQLRFTYRWNPLLCAFLAVLALLQALTTPLWYIAVAFWVLMIPATLVSARRSQARLDAVETAVRARHP
ncbi:hypothetical protein ACRB68_22290 [Actinomadura sp. RB68]|uniref:Uncharacterized protein n=2 Tax=Actinomadura macrotermitis TaxID=2585200 RepID=A0A7K0BSK1_9ACTN|nr:hypothetical protein [Actinomadura macrotermitis]